LRGNCMSKHGETFPHKVYHKHMVVSIYQLFGL
jgi:hypothetical protein